MEENRMKNYIDQEQYECGKYIFVNDSWGKSNQIAKTIQLSKVDMLTAIHEQLEGSRGGFIGKSFQEIDNEEGIYPVGVELLDGNTKIMASSYSKAVKDGINSYDGEVIEMNLTPTIVSELIRRIDRYITMTQDEIKETVQKLERRMQDGKQEKSKLIEILSQFENLNNKDGGK